MVLVLAAPTLLVPSTLFVWKPSCSWYYQQFQLWFWCGQPLHCWYRVLCLNEIHPVVGTLESFNYGSGAGSPYIAGTEYSVCVRHQTGFCGIKGGICYLFAQQLIPALEKLTKWLFQTIWKEFKKNSNYHILIFSAHIIVPKGVKFHWTFCNKFMNYSNIVIFTV